MTEAQSVPLCPVTGAEMHRDIRPITITYRTETMIFDMPGWYCDASEESIHTGTDMKTSDRMLNLLKARVENLLEPAEVREPFRSMKQAICCPARRSAAHSCFWITGPKRSCFSKIGRNWRSIS